MAGCDVFISYKRGDGEAVEPIARKLKEVGLEVWYDTRLEAGPSFDEQIAAKLKLAKAVLVCWTPAAIDSEWVRGEAALAHEAGKLVACFLKPTKLIPPFNLFQTENLANWDGEDDHAGWAKTFARIASLSDRSALIDWAQLMSSGDPKALRAWASKQPPGPLRVTTRFWLSELDGATVTIPDAALIAAKRRTLWGRWSRLKWYWKIATSFAFLISLGAGLYGYAWLTYKPDVARYDVVFEGSTEVFEGSDVRFNGIRVGVVDWLGLDPEDSNRVIARVLVDAQTPVKTDSVAMQMIDRSSGAAYIQVLAGSPQLPLLRAEEFGPRPRIPTQRSASDELFQGEQDLKSLQAELSMRQLEYYTLMIEEIRSSKEQAEKAAAELITEPAGATSSPVSQ
jgi:TIR domain/MlaD protein